MPWTLFPIVLDDQVAAFVPEVAKVPSLALAPIIYVVTSLLALDLLLLQVVARALLIAGRESELLHLAIELADYAVEPRPAPPLASSSRSNRPHQSP